ncbi:hypothetical protein DEA8626_03179 [Defluviimonas aquaemixtae]|uniref:Uncharacterized protein n=1 Tax=Albidovulum aquaemixtae TaxID=1542388 RepID=A0A2R8BL17_9RHOB|nr:hypothetical protein [Defluviimonas aquaemixtae]SPH24130.1 hypothetical protein DEA8626_03179 [Defluviimonas aquaemixtae]
MTFTKACKIVAILAVAFGLLRLGMGFGLTFGMDEGADLSPYIGSRTTGQVINQGTYTLLVGIALGTLAEISRALQAKTG